MATKPTDNPAVEKALSGLTFSLLEKRKKVVSIPKVRMTRSNAV